MATRRLISKDKKWECEFSRYSEDIIFLSVTVKVRESWQNKNQKLSLLDVQNIKTKANHTGNYQKKNWEDKLLPIRHPKIKKIIEDNGIIFILQKKQMHRY